MTGYYFILSFFLYGFLGWCTEVAFAAAKSGQFVNRGFLNGPICPIYGFGVGIVVQFLTPYKSNLLVLYVASVLVVTALEWVTGFLLEKVFHNKWWDYSDMPLNLNGYVCLPFSVVWGVACVVIVKVINPLIQKGLTFVPHLLGLALIVVLGLIVIADLAVTVAGILKLNKRLESMEAIAKELHHISEQLGENIYHGVAEMTETVEDWREKTDDISEEIKEHVEEIKEHAEELKKRYGELSAARSRVPKRLIKAFPRMKSSRYMQALRDLQESLKKK